MFVNELHRAIMCVPYKVASTTWKMIYYLNSEHSLPTQAISGKNSISSDPKGRISQENYTSPRPPGRIHGEIANYTPRLKWYRDQQEIVEKIDTYFKFMVVRHPLVRSVIIVILLNIT